MPTTEGTIAGSIETGAVVVGIDGSERCRLAVKWAADEARRRSAPLVVMYGQLHEPEAPPAWYKAGDSVGSSGQAVVDDAVGLVATRHPSLAVRGVVVEWPAAMVLTSASRTAELLVVGARGMGGFGELLLGSIGDQCIQYAHCPVVVVHGESDDPAFESASPRIVVGVDGSPGSVRALRWALDEARTLSASVDAVFAWHYPAYYAAVVGPAKRFQVAAEAMVAKAVESAAHWAPDVSFRAASVAQATVPALLDASRGADLLVVGSQGHGGFRQALLGSVAHQSARHATCPVAVVRPRIAEEDAEAGANLWTGISAEHEVSPAAAVGVQGR